MKHILTIEFVTTGDRPDFDEARAEIMLALNKHFSVIRSGWRENLTLRVLPPKKEEKHGA